MTAQETRYGSLLELLKQGYSWNSAVRELKKRDDRQSVGENCGRMGTQKSAVGCAISGGSESDVSE